MSATVAPSLETSGLRVLSSGAAPVPLPLLETYHERGIDIVQAYGLTETGGAVSVLDADDAATHLGSAGKALLSLELRIEDREGNELPAGPEGGNRTEERRAGKEGGGTGGPRGAAG